MGVPGLAVEAESAVVTDTLAFIGTWLKRGVQILGERGCVGAGRSSFRIEEDWRRSPVAGKGWAEPFHPHHDQAVIGEAQGFGGGMA